MLYSHIFFLDLCCDHTSCVLRLTFGRFVTECAAFTFIRHDTSFTTGNFTKTQSHTKITICAIWSYVTSEKHYQLLPFPSRSIDTSRSYRILSHHISYHNFFLISSFLLSLFSFTSAQVLHIGIYRLWCTCCRPDSLLYKQRDRAARGDGRNQMTSPGVTCHAVLFQF